MENLARTPLFLIPRLELVSNSSIQDSKTRTWFELFHSRFQASELGSNSSTPDFKCRNLARNPPFPIPFLSQVLVLKSGMEEFEQISDAWNRKLRSSSQVQGLVSEMEEFESNSDTWNREWKISSKVQNLESVMMEFESSSKLGIGNGGV